MEGSLHLINGPFNPLNRLSGSQTLHRPKLFGYSMRCKHSVKEVCALDVQCLCEQREVS